jgi:hypothetical protein
MLEIPLAHCVRGGMVRAVGRERGKKKGGGRNSADTRKLISAALLFPLLSPRARHHSASDDRNWRNLLRSTTNFPKTTQTEHAKLQYAFINGKHRTKKNAVLLFDRVFLYLNTTTTIAVMSPSGRNSSGKRARSPKRKRIRL